MAVREFKDRTGRNWRVWEVTPESIHPQTKAEDYLTDCFLGGWLVFETFDGVEKRRLCPLPFTWVQRSDSDLEALLGQAEVLRPRGSMRSRYMAVPADLPPSVPFHAMTSIPRTAGGDIDMDYLGVVRRFIYPGGKAWRASVTPRAEPGGPLVLRFVCDAQIVDFEEWPADWTDFSDAQLVELLRRGKPDEERRRKRAPRRHTDTDPRP